MPNPGGGDNVFDEPHMRPGSDAGALACWRCGYNRAGLGDRPCPECGAAGFEPPGVPDAIPSEPGQSSVFDEPGVAPELAGPVPDTALTYARWLAQMRAATPRNITNARTLMLAAAAGPWAVLGAFWAGGSADGTGISFLGVTAIVLFGPIVEEVMKLAAATWAVEKRPYWFSSARQVVLCCAAGGLSFSIIENLLYLFVYIDHPEPWLVWWRWTVCTALHTGCSTLAGLGLARVWQRTIDTSTPPDLGRGTPFLVAAIITHGLYNALAVALELVKGQF